MNEEKLSSEQVPPKFAEWLLAMGCPPENVPPLDKISEMCRGQYYMVWRSLMEHIGPKDTILTKRLQVFNNDIIKCQKKNVFNELDVNMPKELSLWRQQTELKQLVTNAEARVAEERDKLNHLADKVSSKLAHRNLSRKRLQDAQRRSWLLQQMSAELSERRLNLQETKTIADSLCCLNDNQDVESKIEKCISALSRPATSRAGVSLQSVANPAVSSSIASSNNDNDAEEHIASLVKCRGDIIFKELYERRAGLCSMAASRTDNSTADKDRRTPQSVLAHTAALHCSLALEAFKNRVHIKQTSKRIATTLNEINSFISSEACELLVLRCERASSAARSKALKTLFDELNSREGIFSVAGDNDSTAAKVIHNVDKAILSKRDELKRLVLSTAALERQTQNVKDRLVTIFNSFHVDGHGHVERLEGAGQTSITYTPESISTVRRFYEERREKRQKRMELSMDLDVSECSSYNELTNNGGPKFVDELKLYLKHFCLEKNRKLVLESGEKVWIFETVQSSLERLQTSWQNDDITTTIICPSVSLAHNIAQLAQAVASKNELEAMVRGLEHRKKHQLSIDISSTTDEENKTLEKVKKRLNENVLNLQKTGKTLSIGIENLGIWSDNTIKQYINDQRCVDGKTYKDYERAFLECLRM